VVVECPAPRAPRLVTIRCHTKRKGLMCDNPLSLRIHPVGKAPREVGYVGVRATGQFAASGRSFAPPTACPVEPLAVVFGEFTKLPEVQKVGGDVEHAQPCRAERYLQRFTDRPH